MGIRSNDSLINNLALFTKHLPNAYALFALLFLGSVATGIISLALINYATVQSQSSTFIGVLIGGAFSGILMILLPTVLTVLLIKGLKRVIRARHLLFITLVAAATYSVFIILSSSAYAITSNYSLSNAIVLVGDAGIFAWWFFISKVVLGQKKRAALFSLIQPVFNVLLYAFSSKYIFTFAFPITILIIKLFAGIAIFLLISYIILYILDTPLKKNLGFGGIEMLSQMVQSWLFDIDVTVKAPLGGEKFGVPSDVDTRTLVFKKKDGRIKAVLFAPWIHYGPVGALGGSNFPTLIERHGRMKYSAPTFAMHCTVNESNNPVSSSQISAIKAALDSSVRTAKQVKIDGANSYTYTKGAHNGASIEMLKLGNVALATFTRAPKVTEDIAPETSMFFRELIEQHGVDAVLIDAHNSRYESAPKAELEGVKYDSEFAKDYITAIKALRKPQHRGKRLQIGVGNKEAYIELGAPSDLAPGNLNAIVFAFNGFKHALIYLNANNMLPSFREGLVRHMRKRFGINAEIYTTDTHYVNSLQRSASNVLGRTTSYMRLQRIADRAVAEALGNMENVDLFYKKETMKNFMVWGPDVKDKALASISSATGLARLLVPMIVTAGFIIASWIITFV